MLGWHPAKRLRQLRSISARAVDVDPGCGAVFSLYVPHPSQQPAAQDTREADATPPAAPLPAAEFSHQGQQHWQLVYRSEAVFGTINPDWEPVAIDFLNGPPEAEDASEVVVAVHQATRQDADKALAAGRTLRRPAHFPTDGTDVWLTLPQPDQPCTHNTASPTEGSVTSDAALSAAAWPPPPQQQLGPAAEDVLDAAAPSVAAALPGLKPLAAWLLDFRQLHPLGTDLGSLEHPLPSGSLIFEFADGQLYSNQPFPTPPPAPEAGPSPPVLGVMSTAPSSASLAPASSAVTTPRAVEALPSPRAGPARSVLSRPATSPLAAHDLGSAAAGAGAAPAAGGSESSDTETQSTEEEAATAAEGSGDSAALTPSQLDVPAEATPAPSAAPLGLGGLLFSKFRRSAPNIDESSESTVLGKAASEGLPLQGGPIAAAAAAAAGSTNGVNGGVGRHVSVVELKEQVHTLVALQASVRQAAARCKALQRELTSLLAQQARSQQQAEELIAAETEAEEAARMASVLEKRAAEVRSQAAAARRGATVRAQALASTIKALQAGEKRVRDAASALHGSEGAGRLGGALRELIALRCAMAVQAGWVHRLGPTEVRILQMPPGGMLETQLEAQWAGASATSEAEEALVLPSAGGGSGRPGAQLMPSAQGQGHELRPASASHAEPSALYRREIRLSIGGLELDPAVWRKAFQPGGYDWDEGEDRAAAVALGYAAHLVDRLATYLGVPLRYPVAFRGSTSAIYDNYPPSRPPRAEPESEVPPARSATSLLFGRSVASAADPAAAPPVEYPLYCASNKDRPRFGVGVFLLNKDVIQLLQLHGITATGPNQLLHNLHKLLACAESGLAPDRHGGSGNSLWQPSAV